MNSSGKSHTGETLLAWVFGLNPLLIWLGGGLVCWAANLVAVPDSDDPGENRDRAMISGALIVIWPAVLMWLGPGFLAVWAAAKWGRWRAYGQGAKPVSRRIV